MNWGRGYGFEFILVTLNAPLPSLLRHLSIHDGVFIHGAGTKGRLERCDLWGNKSPYPNLRIGAGADPTVVACT